MINEAIEWFSIEVFRSKYSAEGLETIGSEGVTEELRES